MFRVPTIKGVTHSELRLRFATHQIQRNRPPQKRLEWSRAAVQRCDDIFDDLQGRVVEAITFDRIFGIYCLHSALVRHLNGGELTLAIQINERHHT